VGVELAELVDELVSALVAELAIGVVSGAMTVVEAAPVGRGADTGVRVVSVALEAELVLFVDVLVTCTPGLAVGNVNTSAEEVLSWCERLVEDVEPEFAGHSAAMIPPFKTAPSNEFGSAWTFVQPRTTLCATASSASSHTVEQPSLKSDATQDGI
jgi:hypothetical protein